MSGPYGPLAHLSGEAGASVSQPRGSRCEGRSAVREHAIAATRVELRAEGPGAVSIRAVARRAGVPVSSLYRHFDDRAALLSAVAFCAYEDLTDELEVAVNDPRNKDDPEGQFRALAQALRAWTNANFAEFALLYGPPPPKENCWPAPVLLARSRTVSLVGQVIARIVSSDDGPDESIQNSPYTPWVDTSGEPLSPKVQAVTASV